MALSSRSRDALTLLRGQVREQGLRYLVFSGSAVTVALLELLPPWVYRLFIEDLDQLRTLDQVSAATLLRDFLIFALVVAGLVLVSRFAWDVAQEWMYLRTEAALRRRVLRKIQTMPLEALDGVQRGDWLTRVTADLRNVEQFIAVSLPGQVRNLLMLAGITVAFSLQGGVLALALLGSALVLAGLNVLVQARLKPVLEELRSVHGGIMQALLESFEGLPVLRSLGGESFVAAAFERRVQTIVTRGLGLVRVTSLVAGGNGFVTGMLTAGCLTAVGWRVHAGSLTIADALLYPFYLGLFYSSALAAVSALAAWSSFLVEGGRLADFLESAPSTVPTLPSVSTAGPDAVELRGLQVGFVGHAPLTRPFDLRIARGATVVLRGPSGCGKSTLLEMLAGLRPLRTGAVVAHGPHAPGLWKAPTELPLHWSAYVEQRPFVFEGSVRANLAPTVRTVDDARLWDALRTVNLSTFIAGAGGLDLMLADGGKNFSEGQKYRLVLARALLLERPFLLLDEPFASLDPFSVAAVCKALAGARARGTGLVVVTHVVPAELPVDHVLDFGRIVAESPVTSIHRGEKDDSRSEHG